MVRFSIFSIHVELIVRSWLYEKMSGFFWSCMMQCFEGDLVGWWLLTETIKDIEDVFPRELSLPQYTLKLWY